MVVMLLVIPAPRIFLPSPKVAARARDRPCNTKIQSRAVRDLTTFT